MTLQQIGRHAHSITWSAIITSTIVGGLAGQGLARWLTRPRR